ncbi:hypothetical protein PHJA_001945900 [Phtheirospermum japonicum]|uniref:Uncharacterized protein n=1 Tax=Phtheirospermum japonicum TaxID=374723 RepID=A0A830CL75_9LAMI|nr:hypothetical protein PHJA_001945900 [Phtheirospermum japonicum]
MLFVSDVVRVTSGIGEAIICIVRRSGVTDTASVLHEAIEYIKYLHDQSAPPDTEARIGFLSSCQRHGEKSALMGIHTQSVRIIDDAYPVITAISTATVLYALINDLLCENSVFLIFLPFIC